jgi:hypothetical protein
MYSVAIRGHVAGGGAMSAPWMQTITGVELNDITHEVLRIFMLTCHVRFRMSS